MANLNKLRDYISARRLPKVITVTGLDPDGVRFEAAAVNEMRRIVNYGWEREYVQAMVSELRADDVLYDIGANIGLVALHSRCRTIAFEPDPGFFGRLKRNIDLNPNARVTALPVAVGDSDGTTTLYTDGTDGYSPSLIDQHRGSSAAGRGTSEVQTATLDSLVANGQLPAPSVLKMDIEGAEILALRGADGLLRGGRDLAPRALFLEVHDTFLPGFDSSADEVLGMVRSAGYQTVVYEDRRGSQQHLILTRGG